MEVKPEQIWENIEKIHGMSPVVHNLTNYVVMNNTANALLALGASPVMAHAGEEVSDMVGIAGALVINIGTLSRPWVKSMGLAMKAARKKGVPIVLDPVGAGATPYRGRTVWELVKTATPAIIRGNASEIMAMAGGMTRTRGVDSVDASHHALHVAKQLGLDLGAVVCISGEIDYIADSASARVSRVRNGHPLMPKVTGLGCTATALCGAFAAVEKDPFLAAVCAMAVMGIAGEIAGENCSGPGSFQVRFVDALYGLAERDMARIKVEGVS